MTLSPDDVLADLETAAKEQTREWKQQRDPEVDLDVDVDGVALGALADLEVDE